MGLAPSTWWFVGRGWANSSALFDRNCPQVGDKARVVVLASEVQELESAAMSVISPGEHSSPRAVSDAPQKPLNVLMVGSAGGHLAQLLQLAPWFADHQCTWVTFKLPDAVSLLRNQDTVWGHHPTTRNVPNLFRNLRLAWRVILDRRPDVIVSSGAAIAVPFFWLGKLFGAKTVYLEVIDRIDTRTLTARLCSPLTDLVVAQDESQKLLFPGCHVIGRLL
jgi:Oligosaccharide biosynthesis protein Alg14 like